MEKFKNLRQICRQNKVFLIVASLVIIADQLTKLWIKSNLALGESICDIGFFNICRIHNTGAGFGMLRGQFLLLSIISVIGACAVLFLVFYMIKHLPFLNKTPGLLSLGLIFGGTVGNLIDRLTQRYVVDFINFSFFPAFNVADSSLVVGAILLAILVLQYNNQSHKA